MYWPHTALQGQKEKEKGENIETIKKILMNY